MTFVPGPAPPSFWLARPRPPEEVDTAVIGAGIVGLSTAWWLGRRGRTGVVIDAETVARGASGRNAGFLLTGTAEPYLRLAREMGEEAARRLWELSAENRELLRREVLDPGEVECEFLPEGSWIAALDDAEQTAELEAGCEALLKLGIELEWKSPAETQAAAGSRRLGGALFQPRDGGLDPLALCRGLGARSGFRLREGLRVRSLEPQGDGRVRLDGDGGSFLARSVVVAINAYAPALLHHLRGPVSAEGGRGEGRGVGGGDVASAIRPIRAQMLATEPGERFLRGVWYINDGFEYARQLPDGTFLLGGGRREAMREEVGYLASPTAQVQGSLDRFLESTFPRLQGRRVQRRWAGTMAFTADGLPLLGTVPEVPGAYYAAGFNGHGMSLGFLTGRHLAALVVGEEEGRTDLFRPGRCLPNETTAPAAAEVPA